MHDAQCTMRNGKAAELEAQGWRVWLMTLMPFAFEEDFSADHIAFWDLFWSVLMRIRAQRECFEQGIVPRGSTPEAEAEQTRVFKERGIYIEMWEYAILLILGRGLAKSSTEEAAAAMRGCILGGYCLYVCESQDQADEHIGNIKGLIADEDSRVVEFYPHMAIDENAVFKGKRTKNRTDLFITSGGFIARAKGLNASLRGIRIGNLRPDNICLDDVDGVNDSIAVSVKKLAQLAKSIIPTQARRWATILFGQNLISETGVMNLIYTGQEDVLSERTTIGISNTFEKFREHHEYVSKLDEKEGRIKHKILPAAIPTWSGVRISDAQKFLNDSGLDAFLAEYMNSFAHQKTGKVFAFDEKRHVITWDAFEAKSGVRYIPGNWKGKMAADLGYSKESRSAWIKINRAARNAQKDIAGLYFASWSKTFTLDSIDDQAVDIWESLFPDPDTGKKHFEARQKFVDYPELFRVLQTRGRCAPYMKHFSHDKISESFKLNPFDPVTDKDSSGLVIDDEAKAMFYVNRAKINFQSQIVSWVLSHEKTGEQKTLAQKYGIPAAKVARFEADAGVTEANHLLHGDYTMPHPFYEDEIVEETGLYRLGRPYIYFIVRRIQSPEDDRDMRTFREQVAKQPWTQEKLTDLGLTRSIPFKKDSDHCDAFRMFSVDYALPDSTPLTLAEEIEERIPDKHKRPDRPMSLEEQMSNQMATHFAKEQAKDELDLDDDDLDDLDDEEYFEEDED